MSEIKKPIRLMVVGNADEDAFSALMSVCLGEVNSKTAIFKHVITPLREFPKRSISLAPMNGGNFFFDGVIRDYPVIMPFIEDSVLDDRRQGATRNYLWGKYPNFTKAQIRKLIRYIPRGHKTKSIPCATASPRIKGF